MIGQEPEVVAVVRRQAVHQFGNLVLLANASGAAEQAVQDAGGLDELTADPDRAGSAFWPNAVSSNFVGINR